MEFAINKQMGKYSTLFDPSDTYIQKLDKIILALKNEPNKGGRGQKSKRYRKSKKQRKTKTKRRLRRSSGFKYK
jgi:hypothetical protein